jgi:hypothetical protein
MVSAAKWLHKIRFLAYQGMARSIRLFL